MEKRQHSKYSAASPQHHPQNTNLYLYWKDFKIYYIHRDQHYQRQSVLKKVILYSPVSINIFILLDIMLYQMSVYSVY